MGAQVLFSFGRGEDSGLWRIVNDGVMGGRSRSRIVTSENDTAVFEGETSLENNGGFASVRGRLPVPPPAGTSRLAVRVRADGREYQLRIRTGEDFDGVAYRWAFRAPAGVWTILEARYRAFVPTFRGRVLHDVPPIDPGAIREIGLMIADKREGPFRIEVDSIRALV